MKRRPGSHATTEVSQHMPIDLRVLLMIAVATILVGPGAAQQANPTVQAKTEIRDTSGALVGHATFNETAAGVQIRGTLTGVPIGTHAIHIHQTGTCAPPFTTAGGHFNPENYQHGRANPKGRHAGDLPSVTVSSTGRVMIDYLEPMVTLRAGPKSLLDADGSAVVIHASGDDDKTDPDGNSGARIACGVIVK